MKELACLSGILFFLITPGMADPAAPIERVPLPAGPLLGRLADFSAVQTTYAYASDKMKPATATPAPHFLSYKPSDPARSVTLTRAKPTWHVSRVDINGNSVDEWSEGTDIYCLASGLPDPLLQNTSDPTGFPDYNKVDFPDMEWISPKTYQGVQAMKGHPCLVFKIAETVTGIETTAWIDLETRLPVQWQRGNETRTFRQLSPPTDILRMPSAIAAFIAVRKHDREMQMRPIVRGG